MLKDSLGLCKILLDSSAFFCILQDSVRLRGYSQKDPLTEFKEEGLNSFINLLEEVDKEVAKTVFKVKPELVPAGILKDEEVVSNVEI